MKKEFKESLKLLTIPITLIVFYLSMILLVRLFSLPSTEELVSIITNFFNEYGLLVVFISAIIEGFLLLGQYFPGGVVIFLGVITSVGNIPRAIQVVSVVSIAFFISYLLNYLVGRYGWYKLFEKFGLRKALDNAQKRLNKHGLKAVLFSYWEPNLASIIATSAGILKLSLKKFLLFSAIGIIVWNTFWGVLVYKLGESALTLMGMKYVIIVFFIWVFLILITNYIRKIKEEKSKI